jgi:hypothetical protein
MHNVTGLLALGEQWILGEQASLLVPTITLTVYTLHLWIYALTAA